MQTSRAKYSKEEIQKSYLDWVNTQSLANGTQINAVRMEAWENYCDHRDGLAKGTTTKSRLTRERKEKLGTIQTVH